MPRRDQPRDGKERMHARRRNRVRTRRQARGTAEDGQRRPSVRAYVATGVARRGMDVNLRGQTNGMVVGETFVAPERRGNDGNNKLEENRPRHHGRATSSLAIGRCSCHGNVSGCAHATKQGFGRPRVPQTMSFLQANRHPTASSLCLPHHLRPHEEALLANAFLVQGTTREETTNPCVSWIRAMATLDPNSIRSWTCSLVVPSLRLRAVVSHALW